MGNMSQHSADNNYSLKPLSWYKCLATLKGRLASGAFLIEGEKALKQLMEHQPNVISEIVSVRKFPREYHRYPVRTVTDIQFRTICSTKSPQGILGVIHLPLETYSDVLPDMAGEKVLMLEDVQDPGNVGTLIRTAAAFGYSGIILSEKCADPFSPKCVQSTAGAVMSVWIRRTNHYLELLKNLRKEGYVVVAVDLSGLEDPTILYHDDKLVIILGNEASGLSGAALRESNYRLRIPIVQEKAESLNVAVCGAICMYLSSLATND